MQVTNKETLFPMQRPIVSGRVGVLACAAITCAAITSVACDPVQIGIKPAATQSIPLHSIAEPPGARRDAAATLAGGHGLSPSASGVSRGGFYRLPGRRDLRARRALRWGIQSDGRRTLRYAGQRDAHAGGGSCAGGLSGMGSGHRRCGLSRCADPGFEADSCREVTGP